MNCSANPNHHHDHDQECAAPAHLANPGKLDSSLILFVGIVSSIVVVVIFFATEAFYRNVQQRDMEASVYTQPNLPLAEYQTQQFDKLHALKWNEPEKKTATVPIEQAIDAYVSGAAK